MFAILAAVLFLVVALGIPAVGAVGLLPLGLAALALHFVVPAGPFAYRRRVDR
jgi:hypothetical protein